MNKIDLLQYLRDQEEFIRNLVSEIEAGKPTTYTYLIDLPIARQIESEGIEHGNGATAERIH